MIYTTLLKGKEMFFLFPLSVGRHDGNPLGPQDRITNT